MEADFISKEWNQIGYMASVLGKMHFKAVKESLNIIIWQTSVYFFQVRIPCHFSNEIYSGIANG